MYFEAFYSSKWRLPVFIGLGLGLAIPGAFIQSFWADEAISSFLVDRDFASFWASLLGDNSSEANQPLYFLILHFWISFWGTSEVAMRSLSLLCFAASIRIFFLWLRDLKGDRTAAIGSLFFATSAYLVAYAQEARPYSLLLLVCSIAYREYWRYVESDGRVIDVTKVWIACLVGAYTSVLFFGVLASLNLHYLVRRESVPFGHKRNWWLSQVGLGVALIPFVLFNLMQVSDRESVDSAGINFFYGMAYSVWTIMQGFAIGPSSVALHAPDKLSVLKPFWPVLLAGILLLSICARATIPVFRRSRFGAFILIGVVTQAVFVSAMFALVDKPILPRYFIAAVPLVWAAIALAYEHFPRWWYRRLVLLLLFTINIASTLITYTVYEYQKEDYRSVANLIVESGVDGPTLLLATLKTANYYEFPNLVNLRDSEALKKASAMLEDGDHYWLVIDRRRTWRFDPDGERESLARALGEELQHDKFVKLEAYLMQVPSRMP